MTDDPSGQVTDDAADYYEKHGLQQLGETFDLKPIGLHKVMYKAMNVDS